VSKPKRDQGFSEREFYLREFRGRTMAIVVPPIVGDLAAIEAVIDELLDDRVRILLLATRPIASRLGARGAVAELPPGEDAGLGRLWRELQKLSLVTLVLAENTFADEARAFLESARLFKVVWLDPGGGLELRGTRRAFLDAEELAAGLAPGGALCQDPRRALFETIRDLVARGVAAVNVCTAAGLGDELWSYSGSGTLFTRDGYLSVRRLGLDDFAAASDLLQRGVAEGYLAPRSDGEVDRILAQAFGAFVEDRDLAGIGALLRWPGATGEIASLYTLTRFVGEGVGGHLVKFAVAEGRRLGLDLVFACTTSERVGRFFEREGFAPVAPETLPPEKWETYDPARRGLVRCFARSTGEAAR